MTEVKHDALEIPNAGEAALRVRSALYQEKKSPLQKRESPIEQAHRVQRGWQELYKPRVTVFGGDESTDQHLPYTSR